MYEDLSKYTLLTYENDIETSRTSFSINLAEAFNGCQGNCENGFGLLPQQEGVLLLGYFKDSQFIRGEVVNLINSTSEIYDFENKEEVKNFYFAQDSEQGYIEEFMVVDYYESKGINKQKSSVTTLLANGFFMVSTFGDEGQLKNQIKY